MRVAAQHVCLATNVPINRDLTLHTGRVTARKRYAVALPLSAPLPPALYHTTEPAPHTVRVVGNALLVGGEYHASGQFVHHYKDYHGAVEAWARARFPCGEGRLAQWSVQVMEPVDKLGLYGESALSSGRHKVWIATGDSGQPMTGGALAAMTIGTHDGVCARMCCCPLSRQHPSWQHPQPATVLCIALRPHSGAPADLVAGAEPLDAGGCQRGCQLRRGGASQGARGH